MDPNQDRFDRLWRGAERPVARYVRNHLWAASREDREDVLQRIRVRLWKTLDHFDGPSFEPWAIRIAHHACADWYDEANAAKRAGHRSEAQPLETFVDPAASPLHLATQDELSPEMTRALDALIPRYRRALLLNASGATSPEIAAALGCTVNRAQQIVAAARAKAAASLAWRG